MNTFRNLLGIALLAFLTVMSLQTGALSATRDGLALEHLLEQARAEMRAPGLRAAVRFPDGRILQSAVGLGDKENDIPLDDSIGMPGGSTGKTFVSALTMLLVEDGILSLDDPISKYVAAEKWFDRLPNNDSIQVRHLLSHSAGLKDYPGTIRFNAKMVWRVIRNGSAKFEPEELIGFATNKKPLFPAGNGYRYTDVGYLVLGRVLEAATDRKYYDLLEERILRPLQLTEIRAADTSVLQDIAPGYQGGARNLRKDGRMKLDPSSEWTGGGLVTNPTMLVQFLGALTEGRLVSTESLKLMVHSGWRDSNEHWYYGYGLFVTDNGNIVGHGGLWSGYRTHMTHFFDRGISIAVQTNRDGRVNLIGLVGEIFELANTQELKNKNE